MYQKESTVFRVLGRVFEARSSYTAWAGLKCSDPSFLSQTLKHGLQVFNIGSEKVMPFAPICLKRAAGSVSAVSSAINLVVFRTRSRFMMQSIFLDDFIK